MGTLNNPCILKIFGLVQDKSCLMMVQELMICSVLEKLWQAPNEVTENHLKLWSSQIALGMQHMEEQKIVHRDLAARNVLLASMHQVIQNQSVLFFSLTIPIIFKILNAHF